MAEQLPSSLQMFEGGDAPLTIMPADMERPLRDRYDSVSELYGKIDIPGLINALTILQQHQGELPQLQDRIEAIEGSIEVLTTVFIELDEEPGKITEAIQEAERRIADATAELKLIRDQTATLEDVIDELDGRNDDESVRLCAEHRAELAGLQAQKGTQRTIKQLQSRAIEELEDRLAIVQADVDIEKTAYTGSRAQYGEQEVILDRRLQYLTIELGKVAHAATALLAAAENVTNLPQLGDLPPLPGRLKISDDTNAFDKRLSHSFVEDVDSGFELTDDAAAAWLGTSSSVRSVPVYFEMRPAPDPPQQGIEEPQPEDGPLPYRELSQLLSHHQRPRLTPTNVRAAMPIIKAINK